MKKQKFRAWDKIKNEMFYPKQKHDERIVMQLNGTVGLFNGKAYETETDRFVIEECIGKDCNGNDVYDGDIVSFIYAPKSLNWKRDGVVERNQWGHSVLRTKTDVFHIESLQTGYVTGNIHEVDEFMK